MISKFIFVSREGDTMPIADRLQDEGKEVVYGMIEAETDKSIPKEHTEARLSLYENIIDYHDADDVLKWAKELKNKDEYMVILDYGDLWEYSEKFLEMGFTKGVFPTKALYALEDDRQAGKEFAQKHYPDLKVAPVHEFTKIEDAMEFLTENKDKIYVLKSEGSNAETVVPQSHDLDLCRRQIIGALRSEKSDYEKGATLEEKIQNAIELSPVLVTWNGKPLFTLLELENKPLGAGDIGRLTGGAQNLTILTRFDAPINRIAFPPIIYEMAKKQPGIGIYDCGMLYDGKSFYFTEFAQMRWGFGGIFSELEMSGDRQHKLAASRHFDLISNGKSPITWKYGAAVRAFQTDPAPNAGLFSAGYNCDWLEPQNDHLWFYCLQREKEKDDDGKDVYVSNGYRKDFLEATGAGDTAIEAINGAYDAVQGVSLTGLYYRNKSDFLATDYFASIPNRFEFLQNSGLL